MANAALYWERDMSKPYTGGYACGAIRYDMAAEPIAMNDGQCRDCQSTAVPGTDPI